MFAFTVVSSLIVGNYWYITDAAEAITVDDLLPALIFLIIKSDIPNW